MPNWKKIVEDQNRKKYKFPAGWSTREEIAEQLDCSPERVAEILAPAIKAGEVEKSAFPVWDSISSRKVTIVGYRVKSAPEEKPEKTSRSGYPPAPGTRVRRRDGGEGTYIGNGKVQWDSGVTTIPKGSTKRKILPI